MLGSADIRSAIEFARTDEDCLAEARLLHSEIAGQVLSRNHERIKGQLRVSDAGRCAREVWAQQRDWLDIPEDAKAGIRMDNGSLVGAWLACLLKVALEQGDSRFHVRLERELQHDGKTGHADAAISYDGQPVAVVEFKWSAWPGKTNGEAKPQHLVQTGTYAEAYGSKGFIVTYFASAWAKGDWLTVYDIPVNFEAHEAITREYARLKTALQPQMPDPDPPEEYLCKSCRFSDCERNENPLKSFDMDETLLRKMETSYARRNG